MHLQLDNEHHAAGDVEKAARKVLKDLQQEYIDLFLIHWPVVKNCKGDSLKPSIKVSFSYPEYFICFDCSLLHAPV